MHLLTGYWVKRTPSQLHSWNHIHNDVSIVMLQNLPILWDFSRSLSLFEKAMSIKEEGASGSCRLIRRSSVTVRIHIHGCHRTISTRPSKRPYHRQLTIGADSTFQVCSVQYLQNNGSLNKNSLTTHFESYIQVSALNKTFRMSWFYNPQTFGREPHIRQATLQRWWRFSKLWLQNNDSQRYIFLPRNI